MLKLYNTLSRKLESFLPLHDKKAGLYTCGPTVYNTPHIGNWRAFVWEDLLKRYLKFKGFQVTHVMNLTDVDDKTIKGSKEQGKSLQAFTNPYKKEFFKELKELNIEPADQYPEATQHIPEMVSMVQKLLKNDLAYQEKDGNIYYSIKKFKNYGKLSKFKLKKLKAGARVNQDEYEKKAANDFALWKAWTPADGEVYWETKIGKGRPGWHIECSAMSTKYLGETFDIHTGGVDNLFPHHENEIAQSEGAHQKPFVKYWLHVKHLLVNGKKMSKSLGNVYKLEDLKQFSFKTIRMALLIGHYRKQLDFRLKEVEKIEKSKGKVNETIQRLLETKTNIPANPKTQKIRDSFLKHFEQEMDNDLNTPKAFAVLFDFSKKTNQLLDAQNLGQADAKILLDAFKKCDSVLGVLNFEPKQTDVLAPELMKLIEKREELRRQQKWVESDAIRDQLKEKGLQIMDTPSGPKWKKVKLNGLD